MIKKISSDTTVMRCDCGKCREQITGYDFDCVKEIAKEQKWTAFKSLDKWLNFFPGHDK